MLYNPEIYLALLTIYHHCYEGLGKSKVGFNNHLLGISLNIISRGMCLSVLVQMF